MASYYKGIHLVNNQLQFERKLLSPTPKPRKTGLQHIGNSQEAVLDIHNKNWKAYSVLSFSLAQEIWTKLAHVTPMFEFNAALLMHLNSDLIPTLMVPFGSTTLNGFSKSKLGEAEGDPAEEALLVR